MIQVAGISFFIGVAWLLSERRSAVSLRFSVKAFLLLLFLAVLLLKVPFITNAVAALNSVVAVLQDATNESARFLFGYLAGGPTPFELTKPENNFIVVFQVLPLVLVISALSAVLFHWRVLPLIINGMSFVLRRTLGISGPLGLSSASTVFLGTIETPLLIKPYLSKMSRCDFFAMITCSMCTVSGTVMVLYASVLSDVVANPILHILTASLINVPAGLLIAHLMIPPRAGQEADETAERISSPYESTVDALLNGISEGMTMVIGIIGVILVFFALIYLANRGLALFGDGISIQFLLGFFLKPVMFLIGVPWAETDQAAGLMSTKIVLNEFVAYLELAKVRASLSPETNVALLYAFCGFANLASSGIIIGGLSAILPERKSEVVSLTFRSLISGNLATLLTAAVVGLLLYGKI